MLVSNHRYMATLSERIARLRTDRQMSQHDLGKRLGVSHVSVGKWETGQTQNLKLKNLIALCRLFGISADDLLREDPSYRIAADSPTPPLIASERMAIADATCKQPCLPHTLHANYQMLTEEGQQMVLTQLGIAIETAGRIYGTRGGSSKTVA